MAFQTEFLFRRLSDFWGPFEGREDIKNIWDAVLQKSQALNSQLLQSDLSKSLATVPLVDRNDLEYFIFDTLVRRADLETNDNLFWSFEVDPAIFFVENMHEKIDRLDINRILTPPDFFGLRDVDGKKVLDFFRGVAPERVGQTQWTRGSDTVTGTGTIFTVDVAVDDILQGQNLVFFKVSEVVSDTELKIQGPTVSGEDLGPGDGATAVFQLAAAENVIPASVEIFFDGNAVDPVGFTVTPEGEVTFTAAPLSSVASITANYFLGYTGPTATNRRTIRESIPKRLLSRAVYRDRRALFTNFGTQIGLDKPTSIEYLSEVRGIYFARWRGPTRFNMNLGSGILTGIPFSERGQVLSVGAATPTIETSTVLVGQRVITVPPPLEVTVSAGEPLTQDFNLLTDGVETRDFISHPDFFDLEPLKSDPGKFFKFFVVVKGSYAVYIVTETGQPLDYSRLHRFRADIKPAYTDSAVLTDIDFISDNLNFFIGAVSVTNAFDAAQTLEFNYINFTIIPEFLTVNGFADEAAAVASGTCDMDSDSIGIFATGLIQESVSGSPGATILTF